MVLHGSERHQNEQWKTNAARSKCSQTDQMGFRTPPFLPLPVNPPLGPVVRHRLRGNRSRLNCDDRPSASATDPQPVVRARHFGRPLLLTPPKPRSENSERGGSNSLQGRSATRPVSATDRGSTDVGGQPGTTDAAEEPGIGDHERDHQRRVANPYFVLEVIGPPEAFRGRGTRPTDPEVFYVEESQGYVSDGRRVETAVASSRAAARRFKAAARKLGFEVRP
jgi:hypothetical protein